MYPAHTQTPISDPLAMTFMMDCKSASDSLKPRSERPVLQVSGRFFVGNEGMRYPMYSLTGYM